MGQKSKLFRSEVNLSKELFDDDINIDLDVENLVEIESRICQLKTFSDLSHRQYARLLLDKIKVKISNSTNSNHKIALNKLAQIIELKIGTPI